MDTLKLQSSGPLYVYMSALEALLATMRYIN